MDMEELSILYLFLVMKKVSNISKLLHKFEFESHVWFRGALSTGDLNQFDRACELGADAGKRFTLSDSLKDVFSENGSISPLLNQLIPNTRPVRAVYFNKTKETNWAVPWHQDRIIAVEEKQELTGYKNWSQKAGVWHCEPPTNVLDEMLFVRIHLDDTDCSNGAMEIALGSHREGVVSADGASTIAKKYNTHICEAERGDILVLKMLTLHRSLISQNSTPRRTLRIDFADEILPKPLSFLS